MGKVPRAVVGWLVQHALDLGHSLLQNLLKLRCQPGLRVVELVKAGHIKLLQVFLHQFKPISIICLPICTSSVVFCCQRSPAWIGSVISGGSGFLLRQKLSIAVTLKSQCFLLLNVETHRCLRLLLSQLLSIGKVAHLILLI